MLAPNLTTTGTIIQQLYDLDDTTAQLRRRHSPSVNSSDTHPRYLPLCLQHLQNVLMRRWQLKRQYRHHYCEAQQEGKGAEEATFSRITNTHKGKSASSGNRPITSRGRVMVD